MRSPGGVSGAGGNSVRPRTSPTLDSDPDPTPSPDAPHTSGLQQRAPHAHTYVGATGLSDASSARPWPMRTPKAISSIDSGAGGGGNSSNTDTEAEDVHAPGFLRQRASPAMDDTRKYSGDEESMPLTGGAARRMMNSPMSNLDKLRWLLAGLVLSLLLYAFATTLALPRLRGRTSVLVPDMDLASQRLNEQSVDQLLGHRVPGEAVRADTVYRSDAQALVARASDDSKRMTHTSPLSGAPCTSCTFLFPRPPPGSPTSSFFITGVPNNGAGVGHQFGEWLMGPYIALMTNTTYVATDLLQQSARWNSFLGLTDGELTVADLYATYGGVAQIHRRSMDNNYVDFEVYPMTNWTIAKMEEVRQDRAVQMVASSVDAGALTVAHKALSPGLPFPVLIEAHHAFVPLHRVVCEHGLLNIIRAKYCAARIRNPVKLDLYAADRAANRIIITWHLRCGDSCFSPIRATNFDSIVKTTWAIHELFKTMEPNREVAFYFFAQPPQNTTAEEHFAPLLKRLEPLPVHTNWHARSSTTMHHLITSDVLIGAMSGFSWLALLHHNGMAMGAIPSCTDKVTYDRFTGEFDQKAFVQSWEIYKHSTPRYTSFQDCIEMAK